MFNMKKIEEMYKKEMFRDVLLNTDEIKIWEQLDNGCFIGTMTYSKDNVLILKELLTSFEEQYGEEISLEDASDELKLYNDQGKLFIYFDKNMKPISMNGCIYNYHNSSFDFESDKELNSLYFYGLSTLKRHRGKGACSALVNFAMEFAKYNGFDLVYARTDLVGSKSEKILEASGMEVCKINNKTIVEWVDVTETKGDYRKYLWLGLKDNISIKPTNYSFLLPEGVLSCEVNKYGSKVYKKTK